MFFGEHYHSLDEKGRVILPAKFREALNDGLYVTKGLDNCLVAYTKKDWLTMVNKLTDLPSLDGNARNFMRFFLGSAVECEVSRQGRISIPQPLRDYATLDKDIVIVGVANKLEFWAKEKYEEFSSSAGESANALGDALKGFGV